MSTGMAQDDAEVESLQHKQQLLSSEKLDISQKLSQLQQEMEHDIMQFQQTDAGSAINLFQAEHLLRAYTLAKLVHVCNLQSSHTFVLGRSCSSKRHAYHMCMH